MKFDALKYDINLAGMVVSTDTVYLTPGELDLTVYVGATPQWTLTGYWYLYGSTKFLQTTSGKWVANGQFESEGFSEQNYGSAQAAALVNKIIRNNMRIYENNLICARYAGKFTAQQQESIRQLQRRLICRDQALQDNTGLTDVQTATPTGYINNIAYLDALMGGESGKIGVVVSTTAAMVVAAVVVVSVATAVYFGLMAWAKESDDDVKYSDSLLAVLKSKLTDAEYQQLYNETQGMVTKARLKGALTAGGGWLKIGLALVAGGLIWNYLKERR